MSRFLIICAATAFSWPPFSAGAQEADCPAECPWEAMITYSYSGLSDDRAPWHEVHGTLVYSFGGGAVALEGMQRSRFDEWDQGLAVDGYAEFWDLSYTNLRVQVAPSPAFMPEIDLYGELFQALRQAWEVSGSYRFRKYPDDQIHVIGIGLGKYVGSWYIRGRGRIIPYAGEVGTLFSVEARRYFEPPRAYLKLEAGRGRGVEVVAPGPVVELTDTYYVVAGVQKYVTQHVGLIAQAAYSDDDFFTRRTIVVGLMARW